MTNVVAISSLRLDDLAQAIDREHEAAVGAARASLEHAVRCGELLLEAQANCETFWGQWVDANLSFGIRQAEKYTRFARAVRVQPELLNSHSTLDGALSAVADKRRVHGSGTGCTEWYTPDRYVESARQVLGEFDLDPASSEAAQETVRARTYFTKEDDGLAQQWRGKIWCNPPYCDAGKFVAKLLEELRAGRTTEAVLLTNAYTDSRWFHAAADACAAICFAAGRIYYTRPSGEPMQPSWGSAFFYFGDHVHRFRAAFADHGLILLPAGRGS